MGEGRCGRGDAGVNSAEPIRVLQVFASLDRGGAETSVMNYYRHVRRDRVQFDFVVHTPSRGAYEREIEALGGHIYRLPRLRWTNLIAYSRAWRDLLRSHQEVSIVHGHFFTISSVYLSIAKSLGFATVAHSHASVPGLKGRTIRLVNMRLSRHADLLTACSAAAGTYLYGARATDSRGVVIVKNAIDLERFQYEPATRTRIRGELGIADKFVLGHVGRFEAAKNHQFVLEIFEMVHRQNKESVLVLVGEGSLRRQIEREVDTRGLSGCVVFTGARGDVDSLLQAMDVFLFPSTHEGLGIAAVEAQAAGLPTLVSDAIPHDAHVTDVIESLPLDAPVETWASAILRHAGAKIRVSPLDEIASAGYDIEREAPRLERLYLSLAGGDDRPASGRWARDPAGEE